MLRKRKLLLEYNQDAVVSQLIGMLVIFITASVILALLSLSVPGLLKDAQIHRIESQIDKILIEAEAMFEYTNNYSNALVHVEFPTTLRFLLFGSFPRNNTGEPADLVLREITSNNYYYVLDDGTLHTFHSTARFSNQNMTEVVIFHPGCYDILLELHQKEGKTYVTLHT